MSPSKAKLSTEVLPCVELPEKRDRSGVYKKNPQVSRKVDSVNALSCGYGQKVIQRMHITPQMDIARHDMESDRGHIYYNCCISFFICLFRTSTGRAFLLNILNSIVCSFYAYFFPDNNSIMIGPTLTYKNFFVAPVVVPSDVRFGSTLLCYTK